MNQKLAIVGVFYDGYYDIWEDFLELLSINWPDCPYPVYIVNGERELKFCKNYNVSVIHAGIDAEYSRRVQKALEDIDADYYLLLLDDFFLERPIKVDPIFDIIEAMETYDISYLRMPMPEFLIGYNIKKYKRDTESGFLFIPESDEYTVTCQPSIWKKEFLAKCIGSENYNAWIFEGIYIYSKSAHSSEFLKHCRICLSNPLGLRHGAVQGKMLPNVYEDLRNNGYKFKNHREILSSKQYKLHTKKQKIKRIIPKSIQKIVKRVLKNGSIVERYQEEILDTMKKMGLE